MQTKLGETRIQSSTYCCDDACHCSASGWIPVRFGEGGTSSCQRSACTCRSMCTPPWPRTRHELCRVSPSRPSAKHTFPCCRNPSCLSPPHRQNCHVSRL